MAQIIENRAEVEGIVKSITKHPQLDNYYQVELELKNAKDVEGYPNLAEADVNKVMPVNIRQGHPLLESIEEDQQISVPVRKAYGQVYFLQE